MTKEEAIADIRDNIKPVVGGKSLDMAIEALEQEPCEDAISRTELLSKIDAERKYLLNFKMDGAEHIIVHHARRIIEDMPPVTPQPKVGRCKDCKYFEYDSVAKVDGIPLIVAHEICKKWGDGCKTKEDGYCFLFEEVKDKE